MYGQIINEEPEIRAGYHCVSYPSGLQRYTEVTQSMLDGWRRRGLTVDVNSYGWLCLTSPYIKYTDPNVSQLRVLRRSRQVHQHRLEAINQSILVAERSRRSKGQVLRSDIVKAVLEWPEVMEASDNPKWIKIKTLPVVFKRSGNIAITTPVTIILRSDGEVRGESPFCHHPHWANAPCLGNADRTIRELVQRNQFIDALSVLCKLRLGFTPSSQLVEGWPLRAWCWWALDWLPSASDDESPLVQLADSGEIIPLFELVPREGLLDYCGYALERDAGWINPELVPEKPGESKHSECAVRLWGASRERPPSCFCWYCRSQRGVTEAEQAATPPPIPLDSSTPNMFTPTIQHRVSLDGSLVTEPIPEPEPEPVQWSVPGCCCRRHRETSYNQVQYSWGEGCRYCFIHRTDTPPNPNEEVRASDQTNAESPTDDETVSDGVAGQGDSGVRQDSTNTGLGT